MRFSLAWRCVDNPLIQPQRPIAAVCAVSVARLKEKRFPHLYEHVAIKGGHVAPFKHLDRARQFLNDHFKAGVESGCLRK